MDFIQHRQAAAIVGQLGESVLRVPHDVRTPDQKPVELSTENSRTQLQAPLYTCADVLHMVVSADQKREE